ncbi:MAG: hypothetical protein ACK54Z_14880 [Cyanobacteriota bacterium]
MGRLLLSAIQGFHRASSSTAESKAHAAIADGFRSAKPAVVDSSGFLLDGDR